MIQKATVFFSGHVQGVGFRQQVYQLAKGFECTGWVKNLSDGRVELYLEGESENVRSFIDIILDELDVFIKTSEEIINSGKRTTNVFSIIA